MIDQILASIVNLVSGVSGTYNVTSAIAPVKTMSEFLDKFPLDSNSRINVWLITRPRVSVQRESANSTRVFFNHTIRIEGYVSGIQNDQFNKLVDDVVEVLVRNISLGLGNSVLTLLPANVEVDLVSFVERLCYRCVIDIVVREVKNVNYV